MLAFRSITICAKTDWANVSDSSTTTQLLARVEAGEQGALDELLAEHRGAMRQFIEMRLGPRLRARIDPSDVIQEAQLEIANRILEFLKTRPMPFHVWLRKTTYQNLQQLLRVHTAQRRDFDREVGMSQNSSVQLVQRLFEKAPGPLQQVLEKEMADRVHEAVLQLSETNQEILLMRTMEGLTNDDVAQFL